MSDRLDYINKEKDEESTLGMADYGVRKYDSFTGRFMTADVLFEKYPAWNPYHYSLNNPITYRDGNGYDAVFVVFPDYNIGYRGMQIPFLGHAGVLLIDNNSGQTEYYSFGRYRGDASGKVQSYSDIPDVEMGDNGMPTNESLQKALKKVSEADGKNGRIEGAYVISDDFKSMNDYAKLQAKKTDTEGERKYDILFNNCGHFSLDVINQGEDVSIPFLFLEPIPTRQSAAMRTFYPDVNYTPSEEKE